jgi:hypothetical protein
VHRLCPAITAIITTTVTPSVIGTTTINFRLWYGGYGGDGGYYDGDYDGSDSYDGGHVDWVPEPLSVLRCKN